MYSIDWVTKPLVSVGLVVRRQNKFWESMSNRWVAGYELTVVVEVSRVEYSQNNGKLKQNAPTTISEQEQNTKTKKQNHCRMRSKQG